MLSNKNKDLKARELLDQFVTGLLEINGVSNYDRETFLLVKEDIEKKLYPIVHDIVFKFAISDSVKNIRI